MKKFVTFLSGLLLGVSLFTPFVQAATSVFVVQQGGTGKGTFTSSQLLYGNGTNALSSVATTTASCAGSATCSTFTVIGSSPITITGAASNGISFSPDSTYAQLVYSTSSPTLWFKNGFFASSTSFFGNGGFGDSVIQVGLTGHEWTLGSAAADNKFYISNGTTLGTNNAISINPATLTTTLPYASTTAVSATSLCLIGDICRTTWPSSGGSGFSTTSADFYITSTTTLPSITTLGNLTTVKTTLSGELNSNSGVLYTTATGTITGTSPVTVSAGGAVIGSNITVACPTCSTGGVFPFSADTNFGVVVYSTTTPTLFFKGGFYASSTSYIDNIISINSTSTNKIASTTLAIANGLATTSLSEVATSTFAKGISATYLNLTGASSATSTSANGLDLSGGCFSIAGTCLQTIVGSASAYKQAVKYASTSTLPANSYNNGTNGVGATITETGNGPLFIDGFTTILGDRILVKNEATGANNGIYTVTTLGIGGVSPFVLTRATDYNSSLDVFPGVASFTNSGTVNANTCWVLTNTTAVTIGTTALTYNDSCGAGSFTGTAPISISGTTISLNIGAGLATIANNLVNLIGFEFTPQINYGVNTSATTTPISATAGIFASSTSNLLTTFLASSTAPQLYLSDTTSNSMWAFRAVAGNLFLSTTTSTVTPFSTTTTPILTFTNNGFEGIGTTSPWAAFTIDRNGGFASSSILVTEFAVSTTTNKTLDWRDGNQQLYRTGSAATTITFKGYVPGQQLKLLICNPNAAAGAITWGSAIDWAGGTAPAQTTTLNQCDVYSFIDTMATSTNKIFGAQTAGFQ